MLRGLGLVFLEDFNMLCCRQCRGGLDTNWYGHCTSRKHGLKVTSQQRRHVDSHYANRNPKYFEASEERLPALPFRPVCEGYRCPQCPYFASIAQTMTNHFSGKSHGGVMEACLVQRASDSKHHPFFPVLAPTPAPQAMPENDGEAGSAPPPAAMTQEQADEAVRLHLQGLAQVVAAEDRRQLSQFFKSSSWHDLTRLEGIPIADLVRTALSEDEGRKRAV